MACNIDVLTDTSDWKLTTSTQNSPQHVRVLRSSHVGRKIASLFGVLISGAGRPCHVPKHIASVKIRGRISPAAGGGRRRIRLAAGAGDASAAEPTAETVFGGHRSAIELT